MKHEIIDKVSRFVKRFGMPMDPVTISFLEFLDAMLSIDDIYEDNPEAIQAIQLHKHGYDFWGPRMQVYGCEADE